MVELTSNERILRAMIRHQVGLLQFAGGVRDDVWKLLDATEADMRAQIANRLRKGKSVPARLRQMELLFEGLRETRAEAWSDVTDTWTSSFRELAIAEATLTAGIVESAVVVELGLGLPDPVRLRSIVKSEPFMGATLNDWAKGIASQDINRIQAQIRMGLTQGEDIPTISRRVVGTVSKDGIDGATAVTRRHAEAITRTATNSIAAASRRELYAINQDIMSGELFAATLDSRTTPICRSLDGKVYAVDDPQKPHLPLHWQERSLLLPIVDGEVIGERPRRDYTEQQLVREYAKANGLDINVPASAKGKKARALLPAGHKGKFDAFARKRVRELTGQAPAKLTYQEWLKGQSAQFQDDILGPTRGKLFREEGLTLDKFVSPQGKQLTLRELALDDVASVKSMGLLPSPYTENFAGPAVPLSSKPPKAKGAKKARRVPTPDEIGGLPTTATAAQAAEAQAAIERAAKAQAAKAAKAAEKASKAQAAALAGQGQAAASAAAGAQKLAAQQAKQVAASAQQAAKQAAQQAKEAAKAARRQAAADRAVVAAEARAAKAWAKAQAAAERATAKQTPASRDVAARAQERARRADEDLRKAKAKAQAVANEALSGPRDV